MYQAPTHPTTEKSSLEKQRNYELSSLTKRQEKQDAQYQWPMPKYMRTPKKGKFLYATFCKVHQNAAKH